MPSPTKKPIRVAVVTGSRADFGLLTPVMWAVHEHPDLELLVIAAGAHLISPALTFRDVKALFAVADSIPMQTAGRTGRFADVEALGKGIARFGRSFEAHKPDWVVVLGDRIEAFAAASAASVAGLAVAHIHGGDRAEGVADEAMRHAITKLAHLHLAASETSAGRIVRMGERPEHVLNPGSPAIDGLDRVEPMSDEEVIKLFGERFDPGTIILHHPTGLRPEQEKACIEAVIHAAGVFGRGDILCLAPNFDPGREIIDERLRAICRAREANDRTRFTFETLPIKLGEHPSPEAFKSRMLYREHLPRHTFLRLLKRLAPAAPDEGGGALIGNSSAGLIEAAALKVSVCNVGPRQAGREKPRNVITVAEDPARWKEVSGPNGELEVVPSAVDECLGLCPGELPADHHPYGDGHAGPRIAEALAGVNPHDPSLLRKHNTY